MSTPLHSVLRTPEECFDGLPGYAFEPHYVDVLKEFEGLRMQCFDADVFVRAGVDLQACKVVLVKSMQQFHAAFAPLAHRVVYTSTPGTPPFDLRSIPYQRVRRPLWPLCD